MKKIAALVVLAASRSSNDKKTEENKTQLSLHASTNDNIFNATLGVLMGEYYHFKDNFITESDTIINVYAKQLMTDADSPPLAALKVY
jgi:hypothetical protein